MGTPLKGMTKTSGEGMSTCATFLDMHVRRHKLLTCPPACEKLVGFVSLLTSGQTCDTDYRSMHNDSAVGRFFHV